MKNKRTFAERLAHIDGRPHHPSEYEESVKKIIEIYGEQVVERRLTLLEEKDLWSGYNEILLFLKNGKLRDAYTGKIIFEDKLR